MSLGKNLLVGLRQLVYPGVCASCRASLPADRPRFCADCHRALTGDPHPTCPRCSSTVGPHTHLDGGCARCRGVPFQFAAAFRLGPYEGLLRELVLRIKNGPEQGLAEMLGLLWIEHAGERLRETKADVVVPVPLHWRRRWSRGYNQAATLAQELAVGLKVPCRIGWLHRTRPTPPQHTQTATGRADNVRGAFRASRSARLGGRRVLLVDDVLTTGHTASEAARALRLAGAASVVVAVLAHG